jgi:hypothetical protein
MPSPVGWDCVYCGAPADTVEHTTPRSRINGNEADERTLRQVLVPACRECNSTLGAFEHSELVMRGAFLLQAYTKRWAKVLSGPVWHEDEIGELGHMLQEAVRQQEAHRQEAVRRFAWLRQWE